MRCFLIGVLVGSLGAAMGALAEVSPGENLLVNPGFEVDGSEVSWPAGWDKYASRKDGVGPTRDFCRSGVQSVRMTAQEIKGGFQGAVQRVPIKGGAKYSLSAYLMSDRASPMSGSATAQLVVEWRNEAGRELSRNYDVHKGQNLSRVRWEPVELRKIKAPADAIEAVVGVHFFDGDSGGKGAVLVDDIALVEE